MPLSVLTLNIWHDHEPWPQRSARIREWIEELDPDLIGFQEVLVGDGVDLLRELVGEFGYHTDFAPAMQLLDRPHIEAGNAVASRWPIGAREAQRLPDRGDWEKRSALTVRIDAPFGPVCFSCTHLHWNFHHGHVRERQIVALVDQVSRLAPGDGFPPIVAGDFNAEPESDEIRYLKGTHSIDGRSVAFLDAWVMAGDNGLPGEEGQGITWSNRNAYARLEFEPRRRIDYIFAGLPQRDGLGLIESCRVVCNDEVGGVWPSDHFGVYSELRCQPPHSGERN
jgi:endonuclease/exonuclease/phosphatase family metal-dependent hydrolase